MKQLLLTLAIVFASAFTLSAAASTEENRENRENPDTKPKVNLPYKDFNHWSLAFQGGISVLDGDGVTTSSQLFPKNLPAFSFKGQVEYALTPSWGLNLTYSYLPYNGERLGNPDVYFNGLTNEATLGASVNLLNLFQPCRLKTRWSLNAQLGFGVAFYKTNFFESRDTYKTYKETKDESLLLDAYAGSNNREQVWVVPVGLDVEYAATKWLGVFASIEYRMYMNDNLDGIVAGGSRDCMGYAGIGVRWKIGGEKAHKPHVRNIAVCEYAKSPAEESMLQSAKDVALLSATVAALNNKVDNDIIPTIEELKRARVEDEKDSDGDGVPDSRDRSPNTPEGAFVNYYGEPLSAAEINKIMGKNMRGGDGKEAQGAPSVYFSTNSTQLSQVGKLTVAEIANKMFQDADLYLDIVGYCDLVGDSAYNVELSTRRAEVVKKELVNKYGIDESRITIQANGSQVGPTKEFMINRRCDLLLKRK